MTVIYQTTITRIGQSAADALSDQMLITFREGAPADIEADVFDHALAALTGDELDGQVADLDQIVLAHVISSGRRRHGRIRR